ncbi:CidA/LrgA family protein [Lederbergia citrea]|uniref:CidA/LrgA family protein n=1 Tax=Lederbergia citrea TaxID=2833581 RepID=UPI0020167120|nr:CidA/LrgA family holin-like protein [Lederbergia citrea]
MKIVKIIMQITLLFIMYMAGVWSQKTFELFIPGSIIGMLLLLILLFTRTIRQEWIETGSLLLVRYLPLLFLPVTVGIITFLDLFTGKGFFIIVIVLISTALVMGCTGVISQWMMMKKGQENE